MIENEVSGIISDPVSSIRFVIEGQVNIQKHSSELNCLYFEWGRSWRTVSQAEPRNKRGIAGIIW